MAARKPLVLSPQGDIQQLRNTDWLENLQVGVNIQEYSEDLQDLAALTGVGLIRKTSTGVEVRELVVEPTSGLVLDLSDPEELALSLADVTQTTTGNFVKITVDAKGRVTGTTPVTAADITTLVPVANFVLKTGDTLSGDLNFNNAATVTGLQDPTDPQDAATKAYVDSVATGLKIKDAVKVATTVNLVGTYLNGTDGVGATFVIAPGPATVIDGLEIGTDLLVGDAVLIKNQLSAFQNGRYVITDITDGTTTPTAFVRADDFNEPAEIQSAYVFVEGGLTQQATGWTASVADPSDIEIGTTDILFSQFSGSASYLAGNGIVLTGNSINVSLKPNAGLVFDNGDVATLVDPARGLELTSLGTAVKLATGSGLTTTAAGLAVVTGNGLQVNGGSLTVQAAANAGISVDANGVGLALRANGGLSTTAGGVGVVADATAGLSVGASGVTIANGALPIAKLVSSSITVGADTGTAAPVALGGTLTINGNATSGIDTTVAAGVVSVSARIASSTQRGTIRIGSGLLIDANGIVSVDFPVVARNAVVDTYTAGQAITAGSAVYFDSGTNRILNADNVTNVEVIGIAAASIANAASGEVILSGNVTLTGLTNGANYFLGATPGTITATVPTAGWVVPIGKANNGKLLVRIGTPVQL